MNSFWQAAQELHQARRDFVVVTMLGNRGHAPQDPGAKAIVTQEGLFFGTIGGGKVEAKAIAHAQTLLTEKISVPEIHTWNLQNDVGMTCGGEVTFLFEGHPVRAWNVVIFGAGHIAQALVRTLLPLQCQITCVDSRSEWTEKLPAAVNLDVQCVENPPDFVAKCSEDSFFAVMTRGHATDMPVLEAIYRRFPQPRYVGVIGSDVKALKIRNELKEKAYASNFVANLRCPMGMDFGTNDPAEIALSICAELLQVRDRLRKS